LLLDTAKRALPDRTLRRCVRPTRSKATRTRYSSGRAAALLFLSLNESAQRSPELRATLLLRGQSCAKAGELRPRVYGARLTCPPWQVHQSLVAARHACCRHGDGRPAHVVRLGEAEIAPPDCRPQRLLGQVAHLGRATWARAHERLDGLERYYVAALHLCRKQAGVAFGQLALRRLLSAPDRASG
jgi:hypothetical protein